MRQLAAHFSPRYLPLLQWLSSLPERIARYLFAVYSLRLYAAFGLLCLLPSDFDADDLTPMYAWPHV